MIHLVPSAVTLLAFVVGITAWFWWVDVTVAVIAKKRWRKLLAMCFIGLPLAIVVTLVLTAGVYELWGVTYFLERDQ